MPTHTVIDPSKASPGDKYITLVQPLNPLICSPVGMVEKNNSTDMCRITHLSYPQGSTINSLIDPEDCKTNYQTLDMALKLVAKHVKGALWPKRTLNQHFARNYVGNHLFP